MVNTEIEAQSSVWSDDVITCMLSLIHAHIRAIHNEDDSVWQDITTHLNKVNTLCILRQSFAAIKYKNVQFIYIYFYFI